LDVIAVADPDDLHDLQVRLTELELKFMEQGLLLDDLDAVVRTQDATLDRLERQLRDLQTGDDPDEL
jgi:uncharacterized coiled-coil protein SlyX